jgi:hypothetical protein
MWYVNSGCILLKEGVEEVVVNVTEHGFVGDTGDGGFARVMRVIGGKEVPCFWEREADGPRLVVEELDRMGLKGEREEVLRAECHCGMVKFDILPPPGNVVGKKESVTRWLRRQGTRYYALLCACGYCRLTVGAMSFASNAYVMPENIVIKDEETGEMKSAFDYTSESESTGNLRETTESLQKVFPGLKCYYSAEDTRRSFCGTCGACIFFERESRPQCVNVSIGILRARSGVLARDWVEWERDFVWSTEEAHDKHLVEAYTEGWKRIPYE